MSTVTKIATVIINFLAILAFFWGVGLIMASIGAPGKYSTWDASAVQMTQIYSEATMYALQGCGLILTAIFVHLALNVGKSGDNEQLEVLTRNTARTNTLLTNLGKAMTKR